jgi:gliding motility-associated-like protein
MQLLHQIRRFTIVICTALISIPAMAQVDTEFWFVAPEVWANHGDSPTLLRFASFDEDAVVTVEQPANPGFPTQTLNIDANSVSSLNLAPWLSIIENKPANTVLNFGLRITSTSLIQAYYEVNPSNNLNPDIFALKGVNALGTAFFVPFQNYLNNSYTQSTSSFDIVATEDNTIIQITPKKPIQGHAANITFSIVLNEGQTWSGRASSTLASQHPFGTIVTSNKPIAITMSDDSVAGTPYGGCADIMGDQIVPVSIVGTEYIAVKGNLNGPDKVFFIPTEPNTTISLNGNVVSTLTTLASIYAHTLSADAAYYEASAPVYALHMTGFGCEIGGALLPSIICTGSQEVAFVRSTNEFIGLKILVQAGGEDDFQFNGNDNLITASDFSNVPGTAGGWKYANITATAFVPQLQASRLSNSSTEFHLGIINGGASSGTRYGYFSNYGQPAYAIQIEDNTVCEGDPVTLTSNLLNFATYDWTGPGDFSAQGSSIDLGNASFDDAGEYFVSGYVGSCPILSDSMYLLVYAIPDAPEISGTSLLCEGESLILTADSAGPFSYEWTGPSGEIDGSFMLEIEATQASDSGLYSAAILDHGCLSEPDFFNVDIIPESFAQIAAVPDSVCAGSTVIIETELAAGSSYQWTGPGNVPLGNLSGVQLSNLDPDDSGWYTLNGELDNCPLGPDSVYIQVLENPEIVDVIALDACLQNEATFTAYSNDSGAEFNWYTADGEIFGEGNPWIIPSTEWSDEQDYFVVANLNGCDSDPLGFNFGIVPPEELTILDAFNEPVETIQICEGESAEAFAFGPALTQWNWSGADGFASEVAEWNIENTNVQATGWYTVNGTVGNCPMLPDSLWLEVIPTPLPPNIGGFDQICEGTPWEIWGAPESVGVLQWFHPYWGNMNGNSITMDAAPMEASGIYEAFTLFEGCPSEMVSGALDIIALPEEIIETFENISVERCPEMNPLLNLPQFDSAYSASWNSTDSDGNTTYFGEGPAIVAAGDGAYSVYLTTGAPCLLEASGNFDVETVLCDLLVPNVFSPNQDGSNERFALPDLSYFPNSTCAIYNRWGQVVFESQDFGNSAGWLPTPDEAVDGTYYYVIRINRSEGDLTIIDENGSSTYTEPGTIELKGSLTLIR